VDTQHPPIHHRREVEIVKDLHTVLPGVGIAVLAHTLLEEAIDLSDLSRLMIAAQQSHVGGVASLQTQEELESLDAVVSTINKVPLVS
jgi:hypothetical protein